MAFSFDSSGPADVLFMVDIIRIFSFYCIKKDLTCIYGPIKYLIARREFAFLRNAERHMYRCPSRGISRFLADLEELPVHRSWDTR